MFLAFGESVFGFALLGIVVASLAVIGRYVYFRSRFRKPSVRLRVASGIAGSILVTLVVCAIREGSIEYNPVLKSSSERTSLSGGFSTASVF